MLSRQMTATTISTGVAARVRCILQMGQVTETPGPVP